MHIEIITTNNDQLKETGFGIYSSCVNMLESVERSYPAQLTVCSSIDDLAGVLSRQPTLVILAAKYMPVESGSDIWFSDYFNQNDITFSGSTRETLKYDSNKVLAKMRLDSIGIRTARHFTAVPGQYRNEEEFPFPFPLFLKPLDAANGNGIDDLSLVNTFMEFMSKVTSLYEAYNSPVLVEEYLSGREFTVALIKKGDGEMITSAIEILPPETTDGLRILGATVKKYNTEKLIAIDRKESDKVTELAIAAFRGLGIRGYGRIDIKMDGNGQCFFLEANLVPGMTAGTSYFPKACEIANELTYDEVVSLMLDESLNRAITLPKLLIDTNRNSAL
jgi:D-alanine-D-alanine ligase